MKTKAWFGIGLGSAALISASWAAGFNCPPGVVGDRPFDYARDATNCVVLGKSGNEPGARYGRYYDVLCPGRMTNTQALKVASDLTSGALQVVSLVSVPKDYDYYGLVKRKAQTITSLGHGECWRNNTPGLVATKFRFEVTSDPSSATHAAKWCRDVNQSGSIRVGAQMDREYRCTIHFKSSERGFAQDAAKVLLKTPALLEDARSKNIRMCLLASTDIQCAPCTTSNKLVMRVHSVRKGGQCPAGTIAYAE